MFNQFWGSVFGTLFLASFCSVELSDFRLGNLSERWEGCAKKSEVLSTYVLPFSAILVKYLLLLTNDNIFYNRQTKLCLVLMMWNSQYSSNMKTLKKTRSCVDCFFSSGFLGLVSRENRDAKESSFFLTQLVCRRAQKQELRRLAFAWNRMQCCDQLGLWQANKAHRQLALYIYILYAWC